MKLELVLKNDEEGFKGKILRKRTFLKAGRGGAGRWGVGIKAPTERDKVEQQHAEL